MFLFHAPHPEKWEGEEEKAQPLEELGKIKNHNVQITMSNAAFLVIKFCDLRFVEVPSVTPIIDQHVVFELSKIGKCCDALQRRPARIKGLGENKGRVFTFHS